MTHADIASPQPSEPITAREIIDLLALAPHPEGGFYRQTFQDASSQGQGRAASTLIYFLLEAGQVSSWHRIDAAEVWHHYAGAPLELWLVTQEGCADANHSHVILGNDLRKGQRPQAVVPPHAWQSARSLGPWTLVGCTVAPGFEFGHFELAPSGWLPKDSIV